MQSPKFNAFRNAFSTTFFAIIRHFFALFDIQKIKGINGQNFPVFRAETR